MIECGSIVSIEDDLGVLIVFVVWRKDFSVNSKSGRWFPSFNGDNPSWPVLVKLLKSYKIGVRYIGFR